VTRPRTPLRGTGESWRLCDAELWRLRAVAREADRLELKLLVPETACAAPGAWTVRARGMPGQQREREAEQHDDDH
jgi:hypothetical protein